MYLCILVFVYSYAPLCTHICLFFILFSNPFSFFNVLYHRVALRLISLKTPNLLRAKFRIFINADFLKNFNMHHILCGFIIGCHSVDLLGISEILYTDFKRYICNWPESRKVNVDPHASRECLINILGLVKAFLHFFSASYVI